MEQEADLVVGQIATALGQVPGMAISARVVADTSITTFITAVRMRT